MEKTGGKGQNRDPVAGGWLAVREIDLRQDQAGLFGMLCFLSHVLTFALFPAVAASVHHQCRRVERHNCAQLRDWPPSRDERTRNLYWRNILPLLA